MPSASTRGTLLAVIVTVVTLGGCAGDETDTGGIPLCTGAAYDTCANEHECMSQDCRVVGTVQACTQTCSASAPCPDLDGQPVTCNASGLCEPTAARACRLQ